MHLRDNLCICIEKKDKNFSIPYFWNEQESRGQ